MEIKNGLHKAPRPVEPDRISGVFLKYQTLLKRYIARFIRQPQDIEDIVHETFLRSYAAEISSHIESPRAFLFKTAKNLALKHLDRCSTRLVDHMADLSSLEVLVDELCCERKVQSQEQFYTFCRAVSALPLQCRKAFILRKIYGFSHKEIAENLEISVSTVEKHLAHGLLKCSEYMRLKETASTEGVAGRRSVNR
jgi:RNA polymerase sigma factor (sigma-70 family)